MNHLGRLIAVIAAIAMVVGATLFLLLRSPIASEGLYRVMTAAGLDTAARERHVVPEMFEGWAVVHYGVEGAPQLPIQDGVVIIEYPSGGRLDTSTRAPDDGGFTQRQYFRQTREGLEPLSRMGDIWGEYNHRALRDDPAGEASRSSGFYVGTLSGFRATEWPIEHRKAVASSR